MTKVPRSLRGDLTKWCQEIQPGIYVGNVSARVRERLWQRVNNDIGRGEATLVYNTNNELGYTFRTTRKDKEIVDADGIPLMKSLFQNNNEKRHGFSNAYRYHQAKVFSHHEVYTNPFVVLDLETTGLTPSTNQIISIGAVKFESGRINSFYRLIKLEQGKVISTDIARVTRLNNQLLNAKGVEIKEAIIDLQHFVKNMPIVGYNLLFDERFLQATIIKHNMIQFNNKMVDILPYIKRIDKFCDNYRLETILAKYGIENEQPHNALADARATMELTKKLIKKYSFKI